MLSILVLLAAAVDPLNKNLVPEAPPTKLFGLAREVFLVVGVGIALGLILFLWVYFTHKGRRRHHSTQQLSKPIYRAEKLSPEEAATRVKLRKKRRRHPDNLPRNPTLGETGGLPPIRPDEPPPEPAQQT